MIKKKNSQEVEKRDNMRGGTGTVTVDTLAHQRLRPALEYPELVALVDDLGKGPEVLAQHVQAIDEIETTADKITHEVIALLHTSFCVSAGGKFCAPNNYYKGQVAPVPVPVPVPVPRRHRMLSASVSSTAAIPTDVPRRPSDLTQGSPVGPTDRHLLPLRPTPA
jgi:hypothetical protein